MNPADRKRADEALDWVRRIHDPSFADWEAHAAWLEADARNPAAFDEASLLIEAATAGLASAPAGPPVTAPANDNLTHPDAGANRRRWGIGLGLAAAAGFAAIIAAPAIFQRGASSYVVRTSPGQHRTIALDGTSIALNGGTSLRLDHDDPRIAVLERGEALFSVRHDATHPFEVRAGSAAFRDVGTVFDVTARAGSTEVAVREGAVLYDPGGAAVRLASGQALRISTDIATVQPVDAAGVGGWQRGRLSFRDASLQDVASDVARSIGEPVRVDPAIAGRRFSGVLKIDADRGAMFRRIGAVMGVDFHRTARGWQMVSPSR